MFCTNFREISFNGLIGTVGGYIGLFLGYSFLQITDLIPANVSNESSIKRNFNYES